MPDMNPTAAPSGYVSDAELLAWLEMKSTHQNDALREQMNVSGERQELIQDLSNLKTSIERCTSDDDANAIAEQMKALLEKYEGSPYGAELTQLFMGALKVIELDVNTTEFDQLWEQVKDPVWLASSGLTDQIKSETDKLDKLDGLALVEIQQLVSDAKQTEQLASNVLSSREQSASSIIGNIRG